MIDPHVLLGYPIEFKKLCLVYPPKVKDVVANNSYAIYARLLTYSQEEIEDEYVKAKMDVALALNPFEYILNNAYHNSQFKDMVEQAFQFFIHEPILMMFEEKTILIGNITDVKSLHDLRVLREEDYFDFQNTIRQVCGEHQVAPYDPNLHPRIKAMKAKARYRDAIKRKNGVGLNLSSSLVAICLMNTGINLLNIGELTYASVSMLIRMYQQKEKYNIDIDSLLSGADSKKIKPEYWLQNLDDK